eukprot:TRINITY_DN19864_c0_g1::TRINITY_DN19864_c0_g1_i1::g.29033::m.29033 TRINITY_DN19864_c0_g1::TRINITY_DN19864_c0_g1_i1::g.29033  ORF type:complete len:170 (+),score=71.63,T2SF/PF00482.18/0.96,T2SF/PF00482.18/28 TRINITY_DN19864_c0_g1_i1:41-550(+)
MAMLVRLTRSLVAPAQLAAVRPAAAYATAATSEFEAGLDSILKKLSEDQKKDLEKASKLRRSDANYRFSFGSGLSFDESMNAAVQEIKDVLKGGQAGGRVAQMRTAVATELQQADLHKNEKARLQLVLSSLDALLNVQKDASASHLRKAETELQNKLKKDFQENFFLKV